MARQALGLCADTQFGHTAEERGAVVTQLEQTQAAEGHNSAVGAPGLLQRGAASNRERLKAAAICREG